MSERLAPWAEYVELLKPAGELRQLLLDPASEQLRAELYRQFLMNLSLGYFIYFQSSPEHPDWAPFLNSSSCCSRTRTTPTCSLRCAPRGPTGSAAHGVRSGS